MTHLWKVLTGIGVCLGVFFISTRPTQRPQVYDCFLFYNELELLEVRLHEMGKYVDKFVIVEAAETFRGNPKPYYFEENRQRFEQFANQIIHIKLDQRFETEDPWKRERFQREQVMQGLKGCCKQDLVILSDVDEIVRGTLVPQMVELITSGQAQAVVCEQKMYHGFFNRYQDQWHGSVCVPYSVIKGISTKSTRRLRNMRPRLMKRSGIQRITSLPNAGWHFTSMGGLDRYILKMESYSHAEFDRPELKQAETVLRVFRTHPLVEIDATFPQFIVDHRLEFEEMGFIDQEAT